MTELNPRNIHISEYNYNLPEDRIAKHPLVKRDQSKLLIYKNRTITDESFTSISDYLPEDSLMIFNNTKVIQARLHFQKPTGAQIEIFCLDPYQPHDYALIFQTNESCSWHCMIGNAKKWKDDKLSKSILINGETITLIAEKIISEESSPIIKFSWDNVSYTFADILDATGELPIPPYLNRKTEQSDLDRYQTLYSKVKGSVAAPTAGLHFTEEVFDTIKKKGIKIDEVTLHVGAGTFKPVKSDTIEGHEMHSESISVNKETIANLLSHKGKIIAVGTTSVRTLESLYYIGLLLENDPNPQHLIVNQWQPYEKETKTISKEKSLQNILDYLDRNSLSQLLADTQIIIAPGYQFKIVDGIVTNFHQPQSTLLLLVSAFVEGKWKSIYNHARAQGYRFLSYGDSSLLLR